MLINMLVSDFNKKVKIMTWLGVVAILLGSAALTLSMLGSNHETFLEGFYEGTGAGLVLFGVVLIIIYRLVLKNPERRKKAEISGKDERNQFIILKAAYISFFVMIGLIYIALLVAGPSNSVVFTTLLIVLGVQMAIFFLLMLLLRLFN